MGMRSRQGGADREVGHGGSPERGPVRAEEEHDGGAPGRASGLGMMGILDRGRWELLRERRWLGGVANRDKKLSWIPKVV